MLENPVFGSQEVASSYTVDSPSMRIDQENGYHANPSIATVNLRGFYFFRVRGDRFDFGLAAIYRLVGWAFFGGCVWHIARKVIGIMIGNSCCDGLTWGVIFLRLHVFHFRQVELGGIAKQDETRREPMRKGMILSMKKCIKTSCD